MVLRHPVSWIFTCFELVWWGVPFDPLIIELVGRGSQDSPVFNRPQLPLYRH